MPDYTLSMFSSQYPDPPATSTWETQAAEENVLVAGVLAPVTNTEVGTIRNSVFTTLLSDDSALGGNHLQRALQILNRYRLDSIVYLYWPEASDELRLEEGISNVISLSALKEKVGTFSVLKSRLLKFYSNTNIDDQILEVVENETSTAGENKDLLSCLLLYLILIGEARRRGDMTT